MVKYKEIGNLTHPFLQAFEDSSPFAVNGFTNIGAVRGDFEGHTQPFRKLL